MREKIILLGATGSIGKQCLDILKYSDEYELVGISFNSRISEIEPYLFYFDSLKYVAISDEEAASIFKDKHPSYQVLTGSNSSVKLVDLNKGVTVFNSLMGNIGLLPTLAAIRNNSDVLLSNKESLVIGSSFIKLALKDSRSHIYPVDSEHVALAKLIKEASDLNIQKDEIDELIVTASGGSLRDKKLEELEEATPSEVLKHPTWHMGSKITVDSATLVNKGFEVIEASVLFDFPLERVKAIICKESLVHALLSYKREGEIHYLYEYSPCDMKVAIAYALSKGKLGAHKLSIEDKEAVQKLHFARIDKRFYPAFNLTVDMFSRHSNIGMLYYNAVDTCAINAFLRNEIKYLDIYKALKYTFDNFQDGLELNESNLDENIKRADEFAIEVIRKIKR